MTTSAYPKMGHAPDYSWVAGRVLFTQIQGGCVYITTKANAMDEERGPMPVTEPTGGAPTAGPPVVGTAVKGDTSPPLREMTPVAPGAVTPEPPGDMFVPGGPGWDPAAVNDGDYVVVFGRLAGPGDTREMCPGGTQYVVERVQANP